MAVSNMDRERALRAIEAFRFGVPPVGSVAEFTVGRESAIAELREFLRDRDTRALLVVADYGGGKSHLLSLVRELALGAQCATSLIALDAKSGVSFSKFDQVFGAICREIEHPSSQGNHGIRTLLNAARDAYDRAPTGQPGFWRSVSNNKVWDYDRTGALSSQSIYLALRAWIFGESDTRDLIEAWLSQPRDYIGQKARLYKSLVSNLRSHFRDPRSEYQLRANRSFDLFERSNYEHTWAALCDLDTICHATAGVDGLVVLVDEFEDVINNQPKNVERTDSFWRLFEFFDGTRFSGKTFFAVTPDFVARCKDALVEARHIDYDFNRFEQLPRFELPKLVPSDYDALLRRIAEAHFRAYDWMLDDRQVEDLICRAGEAGVFEQPRSAVRYMVSELDHIRDEQND